MPAEKDRLLTQIVGKDFNSLSANEIHRRLAEAQKTAASADSGFEITIADVTRQAKRVENLRKRLQLVETYTDKIAGINGEITYHSYDVQQNGGAEILDQCRIIKAATLSIARILCEQDKKMEIPDEKTTDLNLCPA